VRERWLPAVNDTCRKPGLPPWYFEEIDDIADLKPALSQAIRGIVDEIDAAPDSQGSRARVG